MNEISGLKSKLPKETGDQLAVVYSNGPVAEIRLGDFVHALYQHTDSQCINIDSGTID